MMLKIATTLILMLLANTAISQTVTFASWNLQWQRSSQLSLVEYKECDKLKNQRDSMDEFDRFNWNCKSPKQVADLHNVAGKLNADIIAVQEVESAEALEKIWPKTEYDYFINMNSPWIQRTGFVVKKADWLKDVHMKDVPQIGEALESHVRHGTELSVTINNVKTKLLSVHLKSGCFDQALDSDYATRRDKEKNHFTCKILKNQVPAIENWMDNALTEGFNIIIIGDFNRRFDSNEERKNDQKKSIYADLSDNEPAEANLFRPTKGFKARRECRVGSPWLIDHAIMNDGLKNQYVSGSLMQLPVPEKGSDHCPISFKMNF